MTTTLTETAAPAATETRPEVVSREAWLGARKALLEKERALTHELDGLRAARRALPWVLLDKTYRLQGPNGELTLEDLFEGRGQLAIYHFMLSPDSGGMCKGCAFVADHIDAARRHFEQAGLSFAAVSRAPIDRIEAAKRRMGWGFTWVSSHESDFNHDFGVSFTPEERESGRALYNYGVTTIREASDMFGVSIFAKDARGDVFHTYSTYHRGVELLIGAFNWLDLTPGGRNETGTMSWVRLHDEY